jgi:hypothetical protein
MIGKKFNLFLDNSDIPTPATFIRARNATKALVYAKTGNVRILSIAYNLGWEEGYPAPSGYYFVKWFINEFCECDEIYIHEPVFEWKMHLYNALKEAQRAGKLSNRIIIHDTHYISELG